MEFDPYTEMDRPRKVPLRLIPEADYISVAFTLDGDSYFIPYAHNNATDVFWALDEVCSPFYVKKLQVAWVDNDAHTINLTNLNGELKEVDWHEFCKSI